MSKKKLTIGIIGIFASALIFFVCLYFAAYLRAIDYKTAHEQAMSTVMTWAAGAWLMVPFGIAFWLLITRADFW